MLNLSWWDAEDPEDRPVILGIHDLDNPTEAHQIRYAAEVIVHVGYDYASHHHDIAMLRVTEPIVFTREVQPICLQGPEDDFLEEGNTCYVAGWGAEYCTYVKSHGHLDRYVYCELRMHRECRERFPRPRGL